MPQSKIVFFSTPCARVLVYSASRPDSVLNNPAGRAFDKCVIPISRLVTSFTLWRLSSRVPKIPLVVQSSIVELLIVV